MNALPFKRHRFPPDTIRLAVWLYFRFTTSLRDVEEMLAERGIDVSYETVRCWANKFGSAIAANIRRKRGKADTIWHLDEMVVRINGKRMFMWRAVDKEGEVLDMLVQKRRNKAAALKLLRKLLKNQGYVPDQIVTDGLLSYPAALRDLGCLSRHRPGRLRENNRVENSHLPVRRRERKMQRFKSQGQAQRGRCDPQRNLQHLQYPASPDLTKDNAYLPICRDGGVERRVRRTGMKFRIRALARSSADNLTTPAGPPIPGS
jgi:putative transposase